MKTAKRNYLILALLGLVFAAPGISAYFFYTHPHWLGQATTNKGLFLDPPVLLSSLGQHTVVGPTAGPKWQLILWSPSACETSCLQQLDKLARIRLALGRKLYDVVPNLLLGHDAPSLPDALKKTLQEQDIQVVRMVADAKIPVLKDHIEIFIANPDNFLVLAYQPMAKPGDIFHDIKQLLNTTEKTSK